MIFFVVSNVFLMLNIKIEREGNFQKLKKITGSTLDVKKSEINGFIYEASHVQIDTLKNSVTPILCLYVSQLHCRPCVDSLLIHVRKFCLENPNIEFLILANYHTIQEFNLFKRLHKIPNNTLLFNVKNNKCPIFQVSSPVIFIYNPVVSKAELVFFPNKFDIDRTWKFLEVVKRRYVPDEAF